MSDEPKLIQVRSPDELYAGLAVRWTKRSGRRVWLTLLREVGPSPTGLHVNRGLREPCSARRSWSHTYGGNTACFCDSIVQGLLHRLADETPDEEVIAVIRAAGYRIPIKR